MSKYITKNGIIDIQKDKLLFCNKTLSYKEIDYVMFTGRLIKGAEECYYLSLMVNNNEIKTSISFDMLKHEWTRKDFYNIYEINDKAAEAKNLPKKLYRFVDLNGKCIDFFDTYAHFYDFSGEKPGLFNKLDKGRLRFEYSKMENIVIKQEHGNYALFKFTARKDLYSGSICDFRFGRKLPSNAVENNPTADNDAKFYEIALKACTNKKLSASDIAGVVEEMVEENMSVTNAVASEEHRANAVNDPVVELRKYKSLLDEGLITEEDYNFKKKQLLGL